MAPDTFISFPGRFGDDVASWRNPLERIAA